MRCCLPLRPRDPQNSLATKRLLSIAMRKILVVDDDSAFVRLLKLNIESIAGYKVFTEDRGSRVVDAARECQPDLILMDLMMPDILGSDAAVALHADPTLKNTKVVFITSLLNRSEAEQSAKSTGRQSVFAKPISKRVLELIFEQEFGSAQPLSNVTLP